MFNKLSLFRIVRSTPRSSAITPSLISKLHTIPTLRNNSLFGELTKGKVDTTVYDKEKEIDVADITPANDKQLQEYYLEQAKQDQINSDKYITPLKRKLFNLNVQQNGFFKNNQILKDPETKKVYKLSLTEQEIEYLEPSIYLQSFRIKSSIKKANIVSRFVRGYKVKNAINQLHFNPKKMATELEILLKKGLEQARQLNLNEDELYIQALWVGSDGSWMKRLDAKGRGRTGVIQHPYIHLKAILRTEQTKLRKAWEKAENEKNAKPRMFLNNEPLNFKVRPYYKW